MNEHKSIHEAKLAVMAEVPYIQKTRTQGLNYSFFSESAMLEHLQPAMVRHGITIAPVRLEMLEAGEYKTARGVAMNLVRILATYQLTHSPSGTTKDIISIGEASDIGDKACAKALTMAMKYALRQAFLIETGDDPDRVPSEPAAPAKQEPPAESKLEIASRLVKAANLKAGAEAGRLDKLRDRYLKAFPEKEVAFLDELWADRYLELLDKAGEPTLTELSALYKSQDNARHFHQDLRDAMENAYNRQREEAQSATAATAASAYTIPW